MNASEPVVVVGRGRLGAGLTAALGAVGVAVELVAGRQPDRRSEPNRRDEALAAAALIVLAVPDGAIAALADDVPRSTSRVVCHCSGARPLTDLGDHPRVASLHPLVSVPADVQLAAARLRNATWAIAGDAAASAVVELLGGTPIQISEVDRARYHATAVVASNHVAGLWAQVERLAESIGLPAEAFLGLLRGTIDSVSEVGARNALTGPVARGDWGTVRDHLAALAPDEVDQYLAGVMACARLAETDLPDELLRP